MQRAAASPKVRSPVLAAAMQAAASDEKFYNTANLMNYGTAPVGAKKIMATSLGGK